jgi:hypothetical protein
MRSTRLSVRCSWIVYTLLALIFSGITLIGMRVFRSSPTGMAVAGFIASLLGFALIKFIGLIYELNGSKRKPGTIPITICFGIALCFALAITPMCSVFCIACSIPMITYHVQASHLIIPAVCAPAHPKDD